MTARLLFAPVWQVADGSGFPISGAKAYFFTTGTLVAATVYQEAALTTPHTQPVVADSAGRFPPIFYSDATALRVQLKSAAGVTLDDVDPFNSAASGSLVTANYADGSVTAVKCASTLVSDLLGAAPLLKTGGTMTGEILLGSPTTVGNSAAGYRGCRWTTHDAAYTLVLTDQGQGLRHTSSTAHDWTISPDGASGGQVQWDDARIHLCNLGTGVVSVKRGAGVTLWKSGGVTSADASLAQGARAVLERVNTSAWVITGAGIS